MPDIIINITSFTLITAAIRIRIFIITEFFVSWTQLVHIMLCIPPRLHLLSLLLDERINTLRETTLAKLRRHYYTLEAVIWNVVDSNMIEIVEKTLTFTNPVRYPIGPEIIFTKSYHFKLSSSA
ncbi:hypothetical protein BDV96DRAFT_649888 [Lophiotrema nucula]|uniref:Uncharacterized protein n=1 Tax=Lophiotrema nucula TaxID=690887 RepID=A0A6A5Z0J8_9PLEO|nr:hypothetical protein BDV96DRAFT_649888 [Lophiotrema nucula]